MNLIYKLFLVMFCHSFTLNSPKWLIALFFSWMGTTHKKKESFRNPKKFILLVQIKILKITRADSRPPSPPSTNKYICNAIETDSFLKSDVSGQHCWLPELLIMLANESFTKEIRAGILTLIPKMQSTKLNHVCHF